MGMMLFLMASGLTLIFGLMDVLNFAHGAFITIGAYMAVTVLGAASGLVAADSLGLNLLALLAAVAAAAVVTGAVGWGFERVIVRRVYGSHLRQILITMGGLIIAETTGDRAVGRHSRCCWPSPLRCAAASCWPAPPSRNTAWWRWASG